MHDRVEPWRYVTERLDVGEWHTSAERSGLDLVDVVCALLTPATTGSLPEGWRGSYTPERATEWMAECDSESTVLLAVARFEPIGLLILSLEERELRLGYVIAEAAWGEGYASELVEGLVTWARSQSIRSIAGGVEEGNAASARVLTKNGFGAMGETNGVTLYELHLDFN